MWDQIIPAILSLATSNKDGQAKAQDIGAMIRKSISSARTAKSVSEEAPWQ